MKGEPMVKGGYQIIDLGDVDHRLDIGMVHEGIYDKIEGTRKAILISGLTVQGVEYHDVFVFPVVNESNYTAKVVTPLGAMVMTITDTDVVTFTAELNA